MKIINEIEHSAMSSIYFQMFNFDSSTDIDRADNILLVEKRPDFDPIY